MKIIQKNNKAIKVEYTTGKKKIFYLTKDTANFAKNLKVGDLIEGDVKKKDGKLYFTFIKRKKSYGNKNFNKGGNDKYQGDMTKMNVLKSVATAMVVLQGQVKSKDKFFEVLEEGYDRLLSKVQEGAKNSNPDDDDLGNDDDLDSDGDLDGDDNGNGDDEEPIEI